METILLTGGSGFIGKNIIDSYMSKKYNILSPSHSELDLSDEKRVSDFFNFNKIDIVIHAAVKPGHRNTQDSSSLFFTNTQMFFNLEKQKNKYKKMIVLGSGAIYDCENYKPYMKEDDYNFNIPKDEHGFCKYVCEKVIENSNNIIDLRLFGVFGKYEDYEIRFISNMVCKAINNIPMTIKQDRIMSYLYIEDLIPIIDFFIINNCTFKSYNVVPDFSIKLSELAIIVKKLTKSTSEIIIEKNGYGLEYSGDNTRIKTEYADINFTNIEVAIQDLIDWYVSNKNLIKTEKLYINK